MRKQLLTLVLLFVCSYSYADEFRTWRSTEIVGAGTVVEVATVAVILHDLTVTSGTAGYSSFQYFSSTDSLVRIDRSTSIVYNCETKADSYVIDDFLPGGFLYSTTGDVRIRVRWEYASGAPRGREKVGKKTAQ